MSTMRINSFTHFFSFIVFLGIFLLPQEKLAAGGVAATLVNSHTVRRTDAQTGRFLGSITVNNALAVACDGETIAVLRDGNLISRYDAPSGRFLGSTQAGAPDATNIQMSSGVIIVQTGNLLKRYDARTGRFLGSTSI
jgi:hypothetical protein